jgi:uncharacterized protein (TIGR04255 family)
MAEKIHIEYKNPPLNEVVFGITFNPLVKMKAAYIGLFWETIKKEFPKCEQAAIIGPIDEIVEPETGLPLPRTWFINNADDHLLQIQKNKFFLNWRKREKIYPHFDEISKIFFSQYKNLSDFLLSNDLGLIENKNYELTYINHIPKGEGWEDIENIDDLFPDLNWNYNKTRFLHNPETIIWQSVFNLPDGKGKLIIKIQPAKRKTDMHPLIILEITARGIGDEKTEKGLHDWFNIAHDWILSAFEDVTSGPVQNDVWRKIENA